MAPQHYATTCRTEAALSRWPPGTIVDSLTDAAAFEDGKPLIRRQELETYLRWLTEGEGFHGAELPLAAIRRPLQSLDGVDATGAVRFWQTGLGWGWERRFLSKATGRAFVALASGPEAPPSIHVLRTDDPHEALADLIEMLSLQGEELTYVQDGISLQRVLQLAEF